MDLKDLLGEELFQQVEGKLGDVKIDIVNDGRWFPKNKWDEVNVEKNDYKSQVNTLNVELGKLQKQLDDNSDATKTIEDLQQQIQDKKTEMERVRKSNAVKLEVLKFNPNDISDIIPHLKDETIKLNEDGSVEGIKEQLETLKENKSYLFKVEEPPKGTGGSLGAGGRKKTNPEEKNYGAELGAKNKATKSASEKNPYEL